jgi:hypothetical protein
VSISGDQARTSSEASEVGIYTAVDIGAEGLLEVIVENDFACIDRGAEDNNDSCENPNVSEVY